MSLFWIMMGVTVVLALVGLVGWGVLRFYSGMGSIQTGQPIRSRRSVDLSPASDGWEWFGEEELAHRTGLFPDRHVPLSIEKERVSGRPDWIRLHISVSQPDPQTIRRAVGEGFKRLDPHLRGGEVRVYIDGKWVGTGGMIREEAAAAWIEGLPDHQREAVVRQVRNMKAALYGVRKQT